MPTTEEREQLWPRHHCIKCGKLRHTLFKTCGSCSIGQSEEEVEELIDEILKAQKGEEQC